MEYDREELLKALNAAAPALGGGVVSELGYFWFDKKHLYATDGGLGICLDFKSDLDCGIPGRQLRDLVRSTQLKTVSIEVGKGDVGQIKMGKSTVKLSTFPSDRRPWKYPDAPDKADLKLSEAVLKAWDMIKFVRLPKGMHAFHYGVVMVPTKDAVEFFTTDGKTIAWALVKDKPPKGVQPVILPWKWVESVVDLTEAGAVVSVLKDCLVAVGTGVQVYSNLLEYPDEPDLPKLFDKRVGEADQLVKLPEGFKAALERADILAGAEEAWVDVDLKKGGVNLSGKYQVGSLNEDLSIKGKVAEVSGKYLAPLIVRGLSRAEEFAMSEQSLVLYGGDDFIYLVGAKG